MSERYLKVSDAAKVVSLSPGRVRELLREKRLEGVRPGGGGSWRISESSLKAYLGETKQHVGCNCN